MPKRTNAFQELVAILQHHLSDGASVEESAMVDPIHGGKPVEVDVAIRSEIAGHQVLVSVEATARGRTATREWVDQMIGKHADLPTDKLVLYSASGFRPEALRKASQSGVEAVSLEQLRDGENAGPLTRLFSIRPRIARVERKEVRLRLETANGNDMVGRVERNFRLFSSTGECLEGSPGLLDAIDQSLAQSSPQICEDLGLGSSSGSLSVEPFLVIPGAVEEDDGSIGSLYLRYEADGSGVLREIKEIGVLCAVHLDFLELVSQKSLKLGGVEVEQAAILLGKAKGLMVASRSKHGLNFTIRTYEKVPEGWGLH